MINIAQLTKTDDVTLLKGRYRVRLIDSELVPLCYEHYIGAKVIVIDLPEAEGYEATAAKAYERFHAMAMTAKVEDELCDENKENLPSDCTLVGDPLKVTFLSIEKLDAVAAANKSRFDSGHELIEIGGISAIDFHLIPPSEAHGLINEFAEQQFLTAELAQHAVVLFCEATQAQPVLLLGRRNNGKQLMTMRALYFDNFHASIDKLNALSAEMLHKFPLRKMCCRCRFNVLTNLMLIERDKKEDGNFVPALFTIDVEWNPDKRFTGTTSSNSSSGVVGTTDNLKRAAQQPAPVHYLQMPPNNATAVVKFKPGWMDGRVFLTDRLNELRYLAKLATHLKAGTLPTWPFKNDDQKQLEQQQQQQAEVIKRARQMIESAKEKMDAQPLYPFDFTDRLWDVLKSAKSIDALRCVFQQIYDQLQTGEFRVLVEGNKVSSLAKMLRIRNPDEIIFPRLEPMTCLQLLIEIGVDRFSGELTHRFLTDGFLPNTIDLEPFFRHSSASLEDRIERLIPLHLALQSMIMIELYVKLPPHEKTNTAKKLLSHFTVLDGSNVFEKEFVYKTNMEDIRFDKLNGTLSNWVLERDFDKCIRPGVLSKGGAVSDIVHIAKHLGVRHFSPFGMDCVTPPAVNTSTIKSELTTSLSPGGGGSSPPIKEEGNNAKQQQQMTRFECAYLVMNSQPSTLFA
ncbi:hypothetical protein niasHS_000952 [Heterodera schachtii]|uniref:Protein zwilch n=1 Tax=Heterodera schachtii TaxID=97005 RepID=A0ABD2K8S4_HETSC